MQSHTSDLSPKIRLWKNNIEKLLFKINVCGVCLMEEVDLNSLETIYCFENNQIEKSLKDIFEVTFGKVANLLPSNYVCDKCVSTILKSYYLLKKVKSNFKVLQKYVDILTQQAAVSSETEQLTEKQLLLTIDNVESLNVPTTVTVSKKEVDSVTKIFLCEVDDVNSMEYELEDAHVKYECPYCGKQFSDFILYKAHYSQHKEFYFRCHKCSKRFKVFNELIQHRNLKHSDDLTVCSVCQIILLSPESTEHEKEHPGQFVCAVCQVSFDSEMDLELHNLDVHTFVLCQRCLKTLSRSKMEHHRCPYKCSECKDECVHEIFLASYRDQNLAKKSKFQCPECDYTYVSKCQIICHANEQHLNHFPYLCDTCGKCFSSRPNLTLHATKSHGNTTNVINENPVKERSKASSVLSEKPNNCNLCGLSFENDLEYTDHQMAVHLTQCMYCTQLFCDIGKLNSHIKTEHPGQVLNKSIFYQCSMCPLDFQSTKEYIQHVSTHDKGTEHVCRVCGETFKTKKVFVSHMRRHRILYDKECPICLKKYTKHTIARHMKLHVMIKNWDEKSELMCDICAAILPNEKALVRHSFKHNEQKQCPHCNNYINCAMYSKHVNTHTETEKQIRHCTECEYTTKFAVCLEAHINRHHLNIRPYKCDLCNKAFYSEFTLKGHMATHRDTRPEHYCHICGKKFISKKAVIFHTRIHTGEAPYPCDLCDLRFVSASRRRQHMLRKHFDPQFECKICQKLSYTQSDLKRHINDCHMRVGEVKRKRRKKMDNSLKGNIEEEN